MHLCRRPDEPAYGPLQEFYGRLLECLKRPETRTGQWHRLEAARAWGANPTWENFIVFTWDGGAGDRLLACVNYGPTQGQCYVKLPLPDLRGQSVLLRDLLSAARYERDGTELNDRGLYLDMPPWGYHVFEMVRMG